MRCKKVKKLILSDFSDGETSERLKRKTRDHIASCSECRKFQADLRGKVTYPLQESGIAQPPEHVWMNIKANIAQQESLLQKLRGYRVPVFSVRKPVLAFVSVMVILVVSLFLANTINRNNAVNSYLEEQETFLDSLNNGNASSYEDIGIPMEDLFL